MACRRFLPSLRAWLCAAALVLAASNLFAQEWTRFRGPNGAGGSDAQGLPVKWTEADYNWKVSVPGVGHSSPVIWGEKVFVFSGDSATATRHVLCLHAADGRQLWKREFPSTPHHLHTRSSYGSCTPAVDADHVYVAWSSPAKTTLIALDHAGKTKWEKDLGPWASQHGFGASPMLFEDLVVLVNIQDGDRLPMGQKPGKSFVHAFKAASGEEAWRVERKTDNASYSVPCVFTGADGKPQIIGCSTGEGIFSLDPATGRQNWSLPVFSMRTVSSPIVVGDLVMGTTGSGGGGNYLVAVRPATGAKAAEEVYRVKLQVNYVPTTIAHGDLVFLWSDKGSVSCVNAATGETYWKERVAGEYSGSPIRVGDRLYCVNEAGVVVVISASKEFKVLAENPLGEPSRSTPAVSGGRVYLRTYSHLISLGGKSL